MTTLAAFTQPPDAPVEQTVRVGDLCHTFAAAWYRAMETRKKYPDDPVIIQPPGPDGMIEVRRVVH